MDISSLRERSGGVMTVAELNGFIKNLFDSNRTLSAVSIKGEISNFTNHRTGHLYFSVKDSESQIRAVMFRSSAARLKFMPENGMRVILHGSVSVYQRDGSYQLYVNSMQPDGVGALYLAYEQLKEKLYLEGLFDEARKLPIPKYPERIGVITSPTGAAVRDIINILGRRYPLAKVYLYPALVQGDGAEADLIKGLDYFEKSRLVDTVIIGRGGGSIEDLWAFNSEALARKLASMTVPTISAVGHETDFTICDFAASLRAPTPSAAAELATPDIRELYLMLGGAGERIENALLSLVDKKRERLDFISERFGVERRSFVSDKKESLLLLSDALRRGIRDLLSNKSNSLLLNAEKLNALSPLSVMSRGFAYTTVNSKIIKSVKDARVGDDIKINYSDGAINAKVARVEEKL